MIKVLFADDHKIVIDGLKLMLEAADDMVCVAEAADGQSALDICLSQNIDVAVIDISMPTMDGIELTRRLKIEKPTVRIIGLSMLSELSLIRSILEFGADGFLPKNASQFDVVNCIRRVYKGEVVLSKEISKRLEGAKSRTRKSLAPLLSRREKEVLRLIINEKTTSEIAKILFVSPGTIEAHRRNMLAKLGVRNTAGLVRTSIENELLS